MQMRLSQIWFLFPLTIGHATLAFTSHDLPPSKATLINVSRAAGLRNQTLDIPIQPASFSVTYEIGGPKLRTTACLMNAVHALKILALGDWYANIVDGTEYQSVSYAEVGISVNTQKRNRSIQARYVVWAIMLGVHHMILENKFELAQFEMILDGKLLGWVHVANNPPPPRLTVAGGHTNRTVGVAKRSAALLSSNGITTDDANDQTESRLTTIFQPLGSTLGIYDIFLPIMNALSDMAAYSGASRTEGLVAGFDGSRGIVCILPLVALEYQWLIRAVARIPAYMLETSRFGEVRVRLAIDGVDVAFGRVGLGPGCL